MKKAQSALEFLTTYGWAFLVILIMIGALAYFGVLDPSRFLPKKCLFSQPVGCVDSSLPSGGPISLVLRNSDAKDWAAYNVSGTVTLGGSSCTWVDAGTTNNGLWPANTNRNVNIVFGSANCSGIASAVVIEGTTITANIRLNYTQAGGTFSKSVTGEFSSRCCNQ